MIRSFSRAALLVCAASVVRAQPAQRPAPPQQATAVDPLYQTGANVTISLLTMGSGQEVWELFGHDALWIHDNVTGRDTVFNWGVFNFNQPRFIQRFLKGRMLYAMGGDPLGAQMAAYRYLNRGVVAQELDLTVAQRDSIMHQIQWYARPENVNYRYDYYQDNCATRVRDIIDNAIGGQIHAKAGGLSGTSYRWHSLRLMQRNKPIMLGVDIGLGRPADRDLTKWETMFLPRQLHDFIATLEINDGTGGMRPLVKRETVLFHATRAPEPEAPPTRWPWLLAAGVVIGALLAWLGAAAATDGRVARVVAALLISIWALAAALLGTVLTLLWTFTDHIFAHANENLLLFNPLWFIVAVVAIPAIWTGRASAPFRKWSAGLAVLAALALVAHVVRFSAQDNLAVIGLALPPALAIAWVARRVSARETSLSSRASSLSSRA